MNAISNVIRVFSLVKDTAIADALMRYDGLLTLEDIVFAKTTVEELKDLDNLETFYAIAGRAGKKRRSKWPLFPSNQQKEEIRDLLIEGLKEHPKADPHLFNKLYGVGVQTYFGTWNNFVMAAGFEPLEYNKARYSRKDGRKRIFMYAVSTIINGERITQEKIRKKLNVHYQTYGFRTMDEIKYPALELVLYNHLVDNPNLSLKKLENLTGYSRNVIKEKFDLKGLRDKARKKTAQHYEIHPESGIKIGYVCLKQK